MNDIDRRIFLALNAAGETGGGIELWAYAIAKFVVLLVPIGIIWLWVTGSDVARRRALTIFGATVCAIALSFLIGWLFPVQRPFLVPIGHYLMDHRPSPSFPSNHGLVMFTCAWTLWFMACRWPAAAVTAAGLLVAWSRVYLGVHWPSDMVGAVAVGGFSAYLAVAADRYAGGKALAAASRIYETVFTRR